MSVRTVSRIISIGIVLTLGFGAGCGDYGDFHSHIADESHHRLYSRILVMSLLNDPNLQEAMEREAAACLTDYELTGVCAYNLFSLDRRYSDKQFDSVLAAADVEAVLILRPSIDRASWIPLPPRFDPKRAHVVLVPDVDSAVVGDDSGFVYGSEAADSLDPTGLEGWSQSFSVDLYDVETNRRVWWSDSGEMTSGYLTPTWGSYESPPSSVVAWAGCRTVMELKSDSMLVGGPVRFHAKPRTRR